MTVTAMPPGETAQPAKKGPNKLILILVAVVLAAGGAYWFILKPAPAADAKPKEEAGKVVTLDAIQINLASGHYLRLGLGLQLTKETKEEVDGSKALDSAISTFTGLEMSDLVQAEQREHYREVLLKDLEKRYDHEVMDVYFREFVTQ